MSGQKETGVGDPAAVQAESNDDALAPYSTDERPAIMQVLQRLTQSGVPVTVRLLDSHRGSYYTVVTSVIGVDGEADRLLLDYGPDEDINRRLLSSERVMVSGYEGGVRIVFPLTGVHRKELDDGPALAAPLPAWLARVQRRRFFRLPTDSDDAMQCRLEKPAANAVRYKVLDLSLGGIALLEPDPGAVATWEPGIVLRDATLEAGEPGEIRLNLEICHGHQRPGSRRGQGVIGCRFLELATPSAAWLERLIRDRERARLARSSRNRSRS